MNVKVVEKGKEKLRIEVDNIFLVNLLNENIWKQRGVRFSAYTRDHPYLSEPQLLVKSKNPKKTILNAADQIIEDVKNLQKQLKKK